MKVRVRVRVRVRLRLSVRLMLSVRLRLRRDLRVEPQLDLLARLAVLEEELLSHQLLRLDPVGCVGVQLHRVVGLVALRRRRVEPSQLGLVLAWFRARVRVRVRVSGQGEGTWVRVKIEW